MPVPYNKQRTSVLYDLIQKQANVPDETWPEYAIKIIGHVGEFKNFLLKSRCLKQKISI